MGNKKTLPPFPWTVFYYGLEEGAYIEASDGTIICNSDPPDILPKNYKTIFRYIARVCNRHKRLQTSHDNLLGIVQSLITFNGIPLSAEEVTSPHGTVNIKRIREITKRAQKLKGK